MQGDDAQDHQDQRAREVEILVRSAMGGDHRSFEQLAAIHHGGIFRMIYARIQSLSDAEDLTQEVFLKAFRNVKTLRSPELFRAWLYRIALNGVTDYRRRQRFTSLFGFGGKEDLDDHPDASPDGFDLLAGKQFWERFNGFLTGLPTLQQEVFRLRFIDHLGIQEIAVMLKRNESTIKTHLYRAIEKFKESGLSQGLIPGEGS